MRLLDFDIVPVKYHFVAKSKKPLSKLPEPVETEPLLVGYARVSTDDQSLDLQMDALKKYGVEEDRIWTDKRSGATLKRIGLQRVFVFLEPGDTLVVWRLDRIAVHVMAAVAEFERQLVSERTRAGMAAKIARGYVPGPEPKLKPHMAKWAQQLRDKGHTAKEIVEKIKSRYKVTVTPRTIYLRTKRTQ